MHLSEGAVNTKIYNRYHNIRKPTQYDIHSNRTTLAQTQTHPTFAHSSTTPHQRQVPALPQGSYHCIVKVSRGSPSPQRFTAFVDSLYADLCARTGRNDLEAIEGSPIDHPSHVLQSRRCLWRLKDFLGPCGLRRMAALQYDRPDPNSESSPLSSTGPRGWTEASLLSFLRRHRFE